MYEYKAKVLGVYDGDGTYDLDIDLGFHIQHSISVRLYGVDTPELRGVQKEAGKVARDYVREQILGKEIVIETLKDKKGKYGRYLIKTGTLAEDLIKLGLGKPYYGGKKEPWTEKELQDIIDKGLNNDS